MFNQRKRFFQNRWFLFALLLLVGIGFWVNQANNHQDTETSPVETAQTNEPSEENQGTTNGSLVNPDSLNTQVTTDAQTPYFLVRVENGTISIYFCNENGDQTFVRHTDIEYALLSQTDQALFQKGIIAKNEEDLLELLQDFGS